jgi:hypothetical protein
MAVQGLYIFKKTSELRRPLSVVCGGNNIKGNFIIYTLTNEPLPSNDKVDAETARLSHKPYFILPK